MNLKTYLKSNPTVLGKLLSRTLTNKELAEQLGYSPVYISQTLKEMGLKKAKGEVADHRKKRSKLKQSRTDFRLEVARDIIAKRITVEKGSEIAKCSERTLYRYIKKLEEETYAAQRRKREGLDPENR